MQDCSTILMLIDDNTCLRYFHPIITLLLENNRCHPVLVARTVELESDLRRHFPLSEILTGYSQKTFQAVTPNIIICNQIWWWDIVPFLEAAVKCNIPVLHYDHGSLIYRNEYLLENNEYGTGYRNNVYLCSHIACWGERGKDCWVSYGVPEEKLSLIGAVHLDSLFKKPAIKESVYDALQIPADKKIIFLYTALTGQNPDYDSSQIPFIEHLEAYVAANPHYQLVVKSHPGEMLWFEQSRYCYLPETKLIANPIEDCAWPGIKRISADDVVAVSTVVVSPFSSALLTPLALNIPIVLMQYPSELVNDFVKYCGDSIFALSSAEQISQAIEAVMSVSNFDCSELAALFNYGSDGEACTRFLAMMERILAEQRNGKCFYLKEEEERLLSVRRYPFLPYPYYHLIKFYMRMDADTNVDYWLSQYLRKFNDPALLLREIAVHSFNVWKDYGRAQRCLKLYSKYKALDFELLHMYKLTFSES